VLSFTFSVKRVYRQLKGHGDIHPAHKLLWKSSCQSKHKVFFLGVDQRQAKHKGTHENKAYGASGLQLRLMHKISG